MVFAVVGKQRPRRQAAVQNLGQIRQQRLLHGLHHRPQRIGQVFWQRDGNRLRPGAGRGCAFFFSLRGCAGFGGAVFFAQRSDHLFKLDPIGKLGAPRGHCQQCAANHRFGMGVRFFKFFRVHAQFGGQPEGRVYLLLERLASGQLRLVVGKTSQRPFVQPLHHTALVHLVTVQARMKAGAFGQRQHGFEHVRAALGARQKRMVAQGFSGLAQVAAAGAFEVKADQIHDAVFGLLDIRAQKFIAEITRNLHHALGRFGADRLQLLAVDEAVLQAELQRFFKKWPCIVKRNGSG